MTELGNRYQKFWLLLADLKAANLSMFIPHFFDHLNVRYIYSSNAFHILLLGINAVDFFSRCKTTPKERQYMEAFISLKKPYATIYSPEL